jgi:hypothetical protein
MHNIMIGAEAVYAVLFHTSDMNSYLFWTFTQGKQQAPSPSLRLLIHNNPQSLKPLDEVPSSTQIASSSSEVVLLMLGKWIIRTKIECSHSKR